MASTPHRTACQLGVSKAVLSVQTKKMTDFHHLNRLIDGPHHQLFPTSLALCSEPRSDVGSTFRGQNRTQTHLCPSTVVNAANAIEKASTFSQKYLRAIFGLLPIYDLRQYGNCALANDRKQGCQRPRRMRGASRVSQSGCEEMISCISVNRRSGSFCTLTSTLNLTCRFSGWARCIATSMKQR